MKPALPLTNAVVATKRGREHTENEDFYRILDGSNETVRKMQRGALYAVTDGVSSVAGGQWAAQLTAERLEGFFDDQFHPSLDTLMQLIQEIDWELRGKEGNAACTLALLWLLGERAHVITVGDSQIFRVRHGEIAQLSPEGKQRAALRVYMGMGPALSIGAHQWHGEVFTGDIFVLTTDGVTSLLQPDEMMERFWLAGTSVQGAAEAIIDEVDRRGGPDDATILLVDVLAFNDLEDTDA